MNMRGGSTILYTPGIPKNYSHLLALSLSPTIHGLQQKKYKKIEKKPTVYARDMGGSCPHQFALFTG